MTTLPDRLRSIYVAEGANYVQEAAREIERLTAELANARAADIHSCHDQCTRAGCVNARLRAEVAGLRERDSFLLAATHDAQSYASIYADKTLELQADVLRLTAERDAARAQWPNLLPELDRLRLDKARLEHLLSPGGCIPDEASYFWCDDDERLAKCRAAIDAALAARKRDV